MFPCFPKPLGGPQKLPTGSLKDSVSVIIMGGEWSFKMSLTKYGSRSLVFYVYECLAVSSSHFKPFEFWVFKISRARKSRIPFTTAPLTLSPWDEIENNKGPIRNFGFESKINV